MDALVLLKIFVGIVVMLINGTYFESNSEIINIETAQIHLSSILAFLVIASALI